MTVDNYITALEKIKLAICEVLGALKAEKFKSERCETPEKEELAITFTEKEIEKLPKHIKLLFKANRIRATVRQRNGVYEIRCQFNNNKITASSKLLETAKKKFLQKLNEILPPALAPTINNILFSDYAKKWLEIKKRTTKPSTYKEYERSVNVDLIPFFKAKTITSITRDSLQSFLFEMIDQGKNRKAEKSHLVLRCIFDLACSDLAIQSPMAKIVLPKRQQKKGLPLTLEEESKLVNYCLRNEDSASCSALLVLLFFGLRRSELKTLTVKDNELTVITSKTKMGKGEVLRSIPFTPIFKRVLAHVDFEKAKNANVNSVSSALKRVFPNHHLHELRYTFITRCKESGVNLEAVMLWAGHEEDGDVRSSRVNRGYTVYSADYLKREAEKVNYIVDITWVLFPTYTQLFGV